MTVLVCGSMTYDNIMTFEGDFSAHVLPEHMDVFNVAFTASSLRKEYGGCAGNICYGLTMLGCANYPIATVGSDFEPYFQRMRKRGIATDHIQVFGSEFTAQTFITTDRSGNQIATFYQGAMRHSHQQSIIDIGKHHKEILLGVISPDGNAGMIAHASQMQKLGIPFLFDPGPEVIALGKDDLITFLRQATWLIINAYEWQVLKERTGLSQQQIESQLEALILTRGAEGSEIHVNDEAINIRAVSPTNVVDPTGCGDAYRAGVIYGLVNNYDWKTIGQLGSLMGSINVASGGAQNHWISKEEFFKNYQRQFGDEICRAASQ